MPHEREPTGFQAIERIFKETDYMKKHTLLLLIAATLMVVIGVVGFAYSEGNSTPAKNCAANCSKFADNNKDGICDSMAVHHANGTCANIAQCKMNGNCKGNCSNHAAMKTTAPAGGCDPTRCSTMSGGCPMKAKAGCSTTK
jgi:hypothetical protein